MAIQSSNFHSALSKNEGRVMDELAKKLGKKLRSRRTELKITQDDLANDANIDRSYIGRIERGQVKISVEILYKLAPLLKCHPRDLLPDYPEQTPQTANNT